MAQPLQVVVCDDDAAFCDTICGFLAGLLGPGAQVAAYTATDALANHEGDIQLAFLDIEMPGADGFDAARRILARHPDALCVFVTSHDGYMKQAFQVHPFGYVSKAALVDELPPVVADALAVLHGHSGIYLAEQQAYVRARDIAYIQARGNYSVVHLCGGEAHTTRKALKAWAAQLGPAFFQCHKGYIVNLAHTRRLAGNALLLADGSEIPCARRQRPLFNRALADYVSRYGRYL